MIPQIELSYYTNSLSLLSIQHLSLKVKVAVTVTAQSADAYMQKHTQPHSHIVYDQILTGTANVRGG